MAEMSLLLSQNPHQHSAVAALTHSTSTVFPFFFYKQIYLIIFSKNII